jgi:ABC-2 type transport system ATP-binding protein
MSNELISVRSVTKDFGKVKAVRSVNFSLFPGEYVALLGPNGAGKTTLVEMIEGIRNPDSGDILIKGKHLTDNKNELYNIMGISFQETRLFEKITTLEILKMFASFYGKPLEKVMEVLGLVGLSEKAGAYTKNLSGGQRQRLALGIALLNDPEILILDEPTTGLDPAARREIWDILTRLRCEKNTSLILTTHYMEEAAFLCDRIVIMDQGTVIAEGTLKELIEKEKLTNSVIFVVNEQLPAQPPQPSNGLVIKWNPDLKQGRCRLNNIAAELPVLFDFILRNNLTIKDFDFHKPTLDDLFLAKTGRRLVG